MTPCAQLSDRMPAVAGGSAWSDAERAHLAACASCADEWRLVAAVRGIPRIDPVDPHRVAASVRHRLAERDVAGPGRGRRALVWVTGLAAAAALVLTVMSIDRPGAVTGPWLTELSELDSTELVDVLEEWSPGGAVPTPAGFVSGLSDLTADELEQVLQGMET